MHSFVQDTTDFIRKLEIMGDILDGSLMCTMDVNSLYTSIPHEEGIEAVFGAMQDMDMSEAYRGLLVDFLSLVLYKNYFIFDGKYYLQIQGTAMGSNVAMTYANLFMAAFEDAFVYRDQDFTHHVRLWLRYIDDIFFFWTGNMDDLMVFKERLDGCLDTISYTLEYDLHEMHFLDVNLQRHKSLRDHLMKNVNLQGKTHTAETWLSAIPDWSYSGHLDHGTCGVRVLEHIESIRMYHHTR
ncbi:uncharacterized protein LOC134572173 isoform X1 [Pelobates fuscus]|uniref:uncharacterized protein LOC134572173 isoform X1 n=1 Tax=Pelobates fuscus TaxID=191477 RepID=UPI002FE462AA